MRTLRKLFENNRAWSENVAAGDPAFFERTSDGQAPTYLWVGCSDSRVPASQIVGLAPGELFVHRNVANLVSPADLNCLSVLQYGVEILKVKHIIVCGHTCCGGVEAALQNRRLGLIDKWLRDVQDVMYHHEDLLASIADEWDRWDMLGSLNALEQAVNVCRTTVVQEAWRRWQSLAVHAWMYNVHNGLLEDLNFCVTHPRELKPLYQTALAKLTGGKRVGV